MLGLLEALFVFVHDVKRLLKADAVPEKTCLSDGSF